MADTLFLISKISFGAAIFCFLLAIFFFFRFRILEVIGDLTGRNAKKMLKEQRKLNESQLKMPVKNTTGVNEPAYSLEIPKKTGVSDEQTAHLEATQPLCEQEPLLNKTECDMRLIDEVILIHTDETI